MNQRNYVVLPYLIFLVWAFVFPICVAIALLLLSKIPEAKWSDSNYFWAVLFGIFGWIGVGGYLLRAAAAVNNMPEKDSDV